MKAFMFLIIAGLVAAVPIPVANACSGGSTETYVPSGSVVPIPFVATGSVGPMAYLDLDDNSVWMESNGVGGLQKTARSGCTSSNYGPDDQI